VAVSADISAIEGSWPADPSPVFFTDPEGLVFVANRPELVLTTPDTFPARRSRIVAGYEIWEMQAHLFPARAMHLTQPVPVVELTAELLLDIGPAVKLALWQSAVAAALCLAFGAFLFLAAERRRALAHRLAAEARGKAMLERRVTERTQELSEANESLRREIAERQEAELRLKKAQADLIQAGKLSALGQMSAGISHELNQPLMAIQSFAENAGVYLDRGAADKAADNLTKISELARRMGRIIRAKVTPEDPRSHRVARCDRPIVLIAAAGSRALLGQHADHPKGQIFESDDQADDR
jgi:two-component system C4-dicarboxylate transport sensor histidine kinase DctB